MCSNTQVRTDRRPGCCCTAAGTRRLRLLESAVWLEVRQLLENPQRLFVEYQRRGQEPASALQENLKTIESQMAKLRRGIARLIDSYAEGLIEKSEFEPRITRMKERVAALEAQVKHLNDEATRRAGAEADYWSIGGICNFGHSQPRPSRLEHATGDYSPVGETS